MARAQRKPIDQFSFDFAPASSVQPGAALVPYVDDLARRIVASGLAPNDAVLSINRALTLPDTRRLPAPWNLPSRLFQWPISFEPGEPDAPGKLWLRHPALKDHPTVQHIRTLFPDPADWRSDIESIGDWAHAVDLMTPELWPKLLETRRFTSDETIASALAFAMHSPRLGRSEKRQPNWTTALARTVLASLDAPEPADRSRALIAGDGLYPGRIEGHIPPNIRPRGPAAAWITIHGIEDGYLAHNRGGWLGVTPAGMALRAAEHIA